MFLARSRPSGSTHLLLKAALCPDAEALDAWRAWTSARDFDKVSWTEMRLLAPVAARLATLDPKSPLRPRIDGLAKNLWTQTQLKLSETLPAFDALINAGIRFLVFKGGAQYAEGLAVSPRRIMGDIDIAVEPAAAAAALDAFAANGWQASNGESIAYLRQAVKITSSANFSKGRYGGIDLHLNPFHYARMETALDGRSGHGRFPLGWADGPSWCPAQPIRSS